MAQSMIFLVPSHSQLLVTAPSLAKYVYKIIESTMRSCVAVSGFFFSFFYSYLWFLRFSSGVYCGWRGHRPLSTYDLCLSSSPAECPQRVCKSNSSRLRPSVTGSWCQFRFPVPPGWRAPLLEGARGKKHEPIVRPRSCFRIAAFQVLSRIKFAYVEWFIL